MMGGDITVASEPGKGSVFTVRLPGSPRVLTSTGSELFRVRSSFDHLVGSGEERRWHVEAEQHRVHFRAYRRTV